MNPSDFDLDLFFRQRHRFFPEAIFHFATAGDANIPKILLEDGHHSATRRRLKRLPGDVLFGYKLNPNLGEIFAAKRSRWQQRTQGASDVPYEFDEEAYLSDFIDYAKRGCFSFDRTFIDDQMSRKYHLVAYPDFGGSHSMQFRYRRLSSAISELDEFVRKQLSEPVEVYFGYRAAHIRSNHEDGGRFDFSSMFW